MSCFGNISSLRRFISFSPSAYYRVTCDLSPLFLRECLGPSVSTLGCAKLGEDFNCLSDIRLIIFHVNVLRIWVYTYHGMY